MRNVGSRLWASAPLVRLIAGAVSVALVFSLLYFGGQPEAAGLFRPPLDKVAHFGLFFILGSTLWLADLGRHPLAVIVVVTAVGVVDEWRQLYLPGRQSDLSDLLVDIVGTLAAVIGLSLLWHLWGLNRASVG